MRSSLSLILLIVSGIVSSFAHADPYASLDTCRDRIEKMRGPFGDVCKRLLDSQEFRKACAEIDLKDRIKCDGSEPSNVFDPRLGTFKVCPRAMAGGFLTVWSHISHFMLSSIAPEQKDKPESQPEKKSDAQEELTDFMHEAAYANAPTADANIYVVNSEGSKESISSSKKKTVFRKLLEHWNDPPFWSALKTKMTAEFKEDGEQVDNSLSCLSPDGLDRWACRQVGMFVFFEPLRVLRSFTGSKAKMGAWVAAHGDKIQEFIADYDSLTMSGSGR